jgi:hypothetical protein
MNDFISNNILLDIVFWFFCAFVTVLIAALMKRNVILWMLLGIIFGVFAIIALLLLPRKRKKIYGIPHKNRMESRSWYLQIKEEFEEHKKKEISAQNDK